MTARLLVPEFVMVIESAVEAIPAGVFGKARADVESVAVAGELTTELELAEQPASKPRTAMDAARLETR